VATAAPVTPVRNPRRVTDIGIPPLCKQVLIFSFAGSQRQIGIWRRRRYRCLALQMDEEESYR
jgi:hypothetical protein